MHIAFVHTFGNKAKPAPSYENPPKEVAPYHWRTSYVYESGVNSMVSKLFQIKKIDIENEFALPHTTVARLKFGDSFVNTIVTAACPINENETKLFVKSYRNFLCSPIFDPMFYKTMVDTLNQDKAVIESIKKENMDGKFNMKFDKLQNTYKTLYKKFIKA
jgi:Vanillate O-demethylase oxygenase C-terminal domain